ncbi:hypothetical protein C8J56DRAFT_32988 [Mycena floridula]|nr:hypothetical protein C8J56DRAFT_32988 [Mycena floridula]
MYPHSSLLKSLNKIASYTTKLDLSSVRVVFFVRLTSLQTTIRLVGTQVPNDDVLQALTTKLCKIALNLNMEHLEWPFAAEDEGDILKDIAHIESLLESGQSPASVPVVVNARDVQLGTVNGPAFSNNTINQADPAVRRKVDILTKHVIGEYLSSVSSIN